MSRAASSLLTLTAALLACFSLSHSLCARPKANSPSDFAQNALKSYANYTAEDFEDEVGCLKLELLKSGAKTHFLHNFNASLSEKSQKRCEKILDDYKEWKSERFCKGVEVNDSVFYRYMLVLLEKPPRETQEAEIEEFKGHLDAIMRALLACFVDDSLIEFF